MIITGEPCDNCGRPDVWMKGIIDKECRILKEADGYKRMVYTQVENWRCNTCGQLRILETELTMFTFSSSAEPLVFNLDL